MIQSVEHGYYASMPAAPEREGYKFDHWVSAIRMPTRRSFSFNDAILCGYRGSCAVYTAIQPKITVVKVKDAAGMVENWRTGSKAAGGRTSVTRTD
ncbi:MAG: hypothetical protein V8T01_06020 [Oscillospiraceae bacterium]